MARGIVSPEQCATADRMLGRCILDAGHAGPCLPYSLARERIGGRLARPEDGEVECALRREDDGDVFAWITVRAVPAVGDSLVFNGEPFHVAHRTWRTLDAAPHRGRFPDEHLCFLTLSKHWPGRVGSTVLVPGLGAVLLTSVLRTVEIRDPAAAAQHAAAALRRVRELARAWVRDADEFDHDLTCTGESLAELRAAFEAFDLACEASVVARDAAPPLPPFEE